MLHFFVYMYRFFQSSFSSYASCSKIVRRYLRRFYSKLLVQQRLRQKLRRPTETGGFMLHCLSFVTLTIIMVIKVIDCTECCNITHRSKKKKMDKNAQFNFNNYFIVKSVHLITFVHRTLDIIPTYQEASLLLHYKHQIKLSIKSHYKL